MYDLGYARISNISTRPEAIRSASHEPASDRDSVYGWN